MKIKEKTYVVKRPNKGWCVVYGSPTQDKIWTAFQRESFAKEFQTAWNNNEVVRTPIAFHSDECCGCTDFYFSPLKQEIIAVCNECGAKRELMMNVVGTDGILGATVPFVDGIMDELGQAGGKMAQELYKDNKEAK